MLPLKKTAVVAALWFAVGSSAFGQTNFTPPIAEAPHTVKLADVRLRDSAVWVDTNAGIYYLVSAGRRGPNGRAAVIEYTSKDLDTWVGPKVIFEVPTNFWANRGIWAPEMHSYNGKFYLFLTFNTDHLFSEQWRDWLPRVERGSQILVSDAPTGPFVPFTNRSTLPTDMMTLDGTFFIEDGVPYMVFAHEWVQIKDGTVEYIQLKDDLSETVGEPKRLFHGSDAPWSKKSEQYGCHVTDAPWMYRTKTGKLLMLWSSGSSTGYAVGIAKSKSGKLVGPWEQQAEPLFAQDGGHPMLFHRLDGQLMMVLHQPNKTPNEREHFFEVEDEGDTLRLKTNPLAK
jgi:arabinan endo-1,5-alpha-L-arabinosidase